MATTPETTSRSSRAVSERRSSRLRMASARSFARCLAHPFVRGIGDGSLPVEVFARWVVQDYRYLLSYVAALEALAQAAPRGEAAARWTALAALSRDTELDLHRAYAARFGLGPTELSSPAWPETEAYTAFLRGSVGLGYGVGVAAVLPCGVDYVAIGAALGAVQAARDPRYDDWIAMYADPAFADAVAFMEAELDGADGDESLLAATYARGARHELDFWEQLWHPPG